MKTIIFSAIFALISGTTLLLADDKKEETGKKSLTAELHVIGMSCTSCAEVVEDALAALAGVQVKSVDPKSCLAIVVYDPSKVDEKKMAAAVKATEDYEVVPKVAYSKLEYENDGSFSLDGKPFTGTAEDTHKNGKQSKSYMFEKGLLNGLIREWYDNGQISAKKLYKKGKRHGLTEYWDEKGELTAKKIYKDDVHVEDEGGEESDAK